MRTSKKIFLIVVVIFFVGLIYVSYDISTRTTFPGSKPQLKERIKDQFLTPDSTKVDSLSTIKR
jgi:cbb3-type cytochrome oxidase subunit 3